MQHNKKKLIAFLIPIAIIALLLAPLAAFGEEGIRNFWFENKNNQLYSDENLTREKDITIPTREGYDFDGYWTSQTGGSQVYNATGGVISNVSGYTNNKGQLDVPVGKDVKLYAHWIENTATLDYNANGGTGAPASQTMKYSQITNISTTSPTRESLYDTYTVTYVANGHGTAPEAANTTKTTSYTFDGWATNIAGTGTLFAPGSQYKAANVIPKDATLYAKWTVGYNTPAIKASSISIEGYNFKGWATSSNGSVIYTAGQDIVPTENMTLYAIWEEVTATLSYSGNAPAAANTPASQTMRYTQESYVSTTVPTNIATTTINAVSYNMNGVGSQSATSTQRTVTYEFLNWDTNGTSGEQGITYNPGDKIKDANVVPSDTALFAKWGNKTTVYNEVTLPTPSQSGYYFMGWATSSTNATNGVVAYKGGDKYTPTADSVTFYAIWVKTATLTLVDRNQGTNGQATIYYVAPKDYKTGTLSTKSISYGNSTNTIATIEITSGTQYYWVGANKYSGYFIDSKNDGAISAQQGNAWISGASNAKTISSNTTWYCTAGIEVTVNLRDAGTASSGTLGYAIFHYIQPTEEEKTVLVTCGTQSKDTILTTLKLCLGTEIWWTTDSNMAGASLRDNNNIVKQPEGSHFPMKNNHDHDYWFAAKDVEVPEQCVTGDTIITLADGTYKPMNQITLEDEILVFNHETGQVEKANINFIEHDKNDYYNIINLEWSNGLTSRIIYEHGFFDLDLNKYVYIHENDFEKYIGDRFYTGAIVNNNYVNGEVILENAYVTREYSDCYSFPSVYHLNFFMENMLSMPGGITGMFNIFEYDETLKYDEAKMAANIEKFGLFDYNLVKDYMTEDTFNTYPAKYINVSIGKGIMTEEDLMYLIERYATKYEKK